MSIVGYIYFINLNMKNEGKNNKYELGAALINTEENFDEIMIQRQFKANPQGSSSNDKTAKNYELKNLNKIKSKSTIKNKPDLEKQRNQELNKDFEKINVDYLKLPDNGRNILEENNQLFLRELANESAIKSILGAPQDHCAIVLQRIYISVQCRIIYFIMILICSFMVVWTFFDSSDWQNNNFFIIAEFIINIIVILDIIFKMKIVGLKRFLRSWTNYFDILVALGCIFLYLTILVMSEIKSKYFIFKGLGPHILFIVWCAWQYLRIILLIKSQMKARQVAEEVISDLDFEIASRDSLANQLKLHIDEHPLNKSQIISKSWIEMNQLDEHKLKCFASHRRNVSAMDVKKTIVNKFDQDSSSSFEFGKVHQNKYDGVEAFVAQNLKDSPNHQQKLTKRCSLANDFRF